MAFIEVKMDNNRLALVNVSDISYIFMYSTAYVSIVLNSSVVISTLNTYKSIAAALETADGIIVKA